MTKINPLFPMENISTYYLPFSLDLHHRLLWIFGNWGNEACFRQIPEQNQLWAGKPDKYILLYSFTKKTFSFKNKSLALQMEIVWIFVESSTKKARCLLLKALQKQDVMYWNRKFLHMTDFCSTDPIGDRKKEETNEHEK